jgi:hypothetical protein
MRATPEHREGAAKAKANALEVMSTGARQQSISFGEIAKLCADRSNRTILENAAWKRREWTALGKLLEGVLNGKLGTVQIRSHGGMTEKDAIEHSGSLANFLKERFEEWLGLKFRSIGESLSRPPEWDQVLSMPEAQAVADAYLRPCCISKAAAEGWLRSQNIGMNKASKTSISNVRSRPGRPPKTRQLELAKKLLFNLRQDPEGTKKQLGIQPGQNIHKIKIAGLIAKQVQKEPGKKIAWKTIINQLGAELVHTVDALNYKKI